MIIIVEGGLISEIRDIPSGLEIEVRDLDVEGALEDEITETGDGPAYVTYHTSENPPSWETQISFR